MRHTAVVAESDSNSDLPIRHTRRNPPPPRAPGVGVLRRGWRSIKVAFDEETFEEIRGLAAASQRSFAEQVRCLVEWGLEAK